MGKQYQNDHKMALAGAGVRGRARACEYGHERAGDVGPVLPYWPKFRISPEIWLRMPTKILEASGVETLPKTPDISYRAKRARNRPNFAPKWTKMAENWLLFMRNFFFKKFWSKISKLFFKIQQNYHIKMQ